MAAIGKASYSRLSVFIVNPGRLPVARLPVYVEVTGIAPVPSQPVPTDHRLDDAILQALRADAAENLTVPQPRERLAEAVGQALGRQLGPEARDAMTTRDPNRFISALIASVRADLAGVALRDIDPGALSSALDAAVAAEAAREGMPVQPLPTPVVTSWAVPLGMLATDHVGYLSFDLTRMPASARDAVAAAVMARQANPTATLPTSITLYPASSGGLTFEVLGQGRLTAGAIVARIELAPLAAPDAVANLGLPAMQDPSLQDWQLSPGSFATNPGALVGADGCETLLPANLASQEYHFYQPVQLTDIQAPVSTPAGMVQLGVVNDYRIAWNPLGHSLGQILYSLPLAPGESVNLAVIDWTRRDEAQRSERTTVDEQLIHNEHRDRSISEAVSSAVQEYQHGSSFMGGIAGAAGGGYSGAGYNLSGGIAGSLGGSTASSSGSRNVTGSTLQNLSDNISQASSSQRELQSTVVVQSNQSEKEAIETRTIVNYNHSHALTVLYYEVLRHFRVTTGLVGQRPAVFVRMRMDWFDGADAVANILAQRSILSAALLEPARADAFEALARLTQVGGPLADLDTPLPTPSPPPVDLDPPPHLRYFTFEMSTGGFVRAVDAHDQHVDVLSTLLLADGGAIDLVNIDGGAVLNNFGAFSQQGTVNVFSALPKGQPSVAWAKVVGVVLAIAVFPTDGDTAKVSFSHIKISGIEDAGPPGVVLVDQPYEGGHLIITNANDEAGRRLVLPAHRPPAAPASAPTYASEAIADREKATALIAHLRAHTRHYSRAIALGMDPFERADALAAITLAGGGSALALLENRPLEVVGDYLAYPCIDAALAARVSAALASGEDQVSADATQDERLVTLSTRGVFAEAKLGHCNASELIDNTRFWDWQQSPIPHMAPDIAAVTPVTPQPTQTNLSPTAFPTPIVNIVNPPAAPDPTGLGDAMKVLATSNIFRDMSGQAQVAALLSNLADDAVRVAGKGGSGSNLARASTSSPTGTGASGIGGARATPTQPSAVNRDLQDLGSVLNRAQGDNLLTPLDAQSIYGNAVRQATGLQQVGDTYVRPAWTKNQLIGLVGETLLSDALKRDGLVVFGDPTKHVAGKGIDLVALDVDGGLVWILDNKAQMSDISGANALTGGNFDAYKASVIDFLEKQSSEPRAMEAAALIRSGKFTKVVANAWAGADTKFTQGLFAKALEVYDIRLGQKFASYAAWEAAFKAIPKGLSKLPGLRGSALLEGSMLVMAVYSAALFVASADDKLKSLGQLAAETALNAALCLLPGGFVASLTIGLATDNPQYLAAQQRAYTIDDICAQLPGFYVMSPDNQDQIKRTIGQILDDPVQVPDPPSDGAPMLPFFTSPTTVPSADFT